MGRPAGSTNKTAKTVAKQTKEVVEDVSEDEDMTLQELIVEAVKNKDHNKVSKGGTDFPIPPAGKTVGRFIEYIELGVQPQRAFKDKAKPPVEEARIVFELLSPGKNMREIELADGTKKQVADKIARNYTLKLNEKALFYKLYKGMKGKRSDDEISHISQMLGEAFLIEVEHSKPNKDKKVYANITSVTAPEMEDAITGKVTKLPVPKALSPVRAFIFDVPSLAAWNKLFIDGKQERNGEQVSKNYLQEKIAKAINFAGSKLEAMLEGADALPDLTETASDEEAEEAEEVAEEEVEEVEEEAAPVAKKAAKAPVTKTSKGVITTALTKPYAEEPKATKATKPVKAKAKTAEDVSDAFAELGLSL